MSTFLMDLVWWIAASLNKRKGAALVSVLNDLVPPSQGIERASWTASELKIKSTAGDLILESFAPVSKENER